MYADFFNQSKQISLPMANFWYAFDLYDYARYQYIHDNDTHNKPRGTTYTFWLLGRPYSNET